MVSNWRPARSSVGDAVSGAEFAPCLPALAVACLPPAGDGLVRSLKVVSLSLAIPRFGLLAHVSSLRLSSGHSGPVLTLSNAARASLSSPHLLVVDASIWATSPLGVAVRHITCGFCLFIFPPGYVAL